MCSPRLPWEVIERVIDHSAHRPKTLPSLALTCRQLLPRTRLLMFTRVWFKNSAHVFAFVDFLRHYPHLKPVVRTVVFSPASFGPSLLHILPNLSSIEYVSDGRSQVPALPAHHIGLACFRPLGTHIRTLCLSKLTFPTLLSFAQLLLAIRSTTHLVCESLKIEAEGDATRLNAIRARLSNKMQLTKITIDYESLGWIGSRRLQVQTGDQSPVNDAMNLKMRVRELRFYDSGAMNLNVLVGQLLFHPKSAVQSFGLKGIIDASLANLLLYGCDWSKLRSLVLQLVPGSSAPHHRAEEVLKLLENFSRGPSLREVTLELQHQSLYRLVEAMSFYGAKADNELENALLRFSQPRLVFAILEPSANSPSLACWLRELKTHFSALSRRGAVELMYTQSIPAGHDYWVEALAVSPDSQWVASGSQDATIILWDANSGTMVQQWVAHSCKSVRSLAFSPDSRFLLSGGEDRTAAVWDLSQVSQGARKVGTLHSDAGIVLRCAWSPDARTLATGSRDGHMWLWDAQTFLPLALRELKGPIRSLAFSPDGCWLACVSDTGESHIVHVAPLDVAFPDTSPGSTSSGCPPDSEYTQTPCRPERQISLSYPVSSAAFNAGSTRLAVVLYAQGPGIDVVDLETGDSILLVPRQHEGKQRVHDVSFSSDGKLVVGAAGRAAHIWDASMGRERCRLEGHEEEIRGARFSPCGEYVGTASEDGTVRLWGTRDGACVGRLVEHTHQVHHLAFSPNGKTLSSGDNHGRVVIRRMDGIVPSLPTNLG